MTYGVLDIEAVGEPWDGTGLAVGWRDVAYAGLPPAEVRAELADAAVTKVTFTKYDYRWLRLRGLEVRGELHDVQTMAWLLDEAQELSLEACALRYLGLEMDKRIAPVAGLLTFRTDAGRRVPLEAAPMRQLLAYCQRDLVATERLYLELLDRLAGEDLLDYWRDEVVPFSGVLADMESRGVPYDAAASEALREQLAGEVEILQRELKAEADLPPAFNLMSARQLGGYLYTQAFEVPDRIAIDAETRADLLRGVLDALPIRFHPMKVGRTWVHGVWELKGRGLRAPAITESGQDAVGAKKLRAAYPDDAWIAKLLEMKQRQTLVSNFLAGFPRKGRGGRLYGRFNQTGTVTGRLSSNSPNLQNIPTRTELGSRVRALFRPEPGTVFIHGDYSQLEPRLMAHYSGDPALLDVFLRGDGDVYADMAVAIWGASTPERRNVCKTLVLAMNYGAGAPKIAQTLTEAGYPTAAPEAADMIGALQARYAKFFGWREYVIETGGRYGFVPTIGGRKRRIVRGRGMTWKDASRGERQAVNAVIQGSAADIVSRVMVRIGEGWPELRLLVQVHDELLLEADEAEAIDLSTLAIVAEKGHGFDLDVPLVFEPKIVNDWSEGKA